MPEPTPIDLLQAIHELGQRMDARFSELKAEVAEIKGRMNDAPTARDFGRIEDRLDEISTRLSVPLAYQPPGKQRA